LSSVEPEQFALKIFVSYPSEQRAHAREVFELLKKLGIDAWFDQSSLIAGQDWDRVRKRAQQEADMTVLICSEETIERAGVIQREIKDILKIIEDKPSDEIFLIPLPVEPVRLPQEIARFQYIDKFDPDWQLDLARSIQFKASQASLASPLELDEFIANGSLLGSRQLMKVRYEDDRMRLGAEYFSYTEKNMYWEFISSKIASFVLERFYNHRDVYDYDLYVNGASKSWWSMRVEEFYRVDELVSLRFFEENYGHGAAHPNRGTLTMNFSGPPFAIFSFRDLLREDPESLNYVRQYCEVDLRRQMLPSEPWPLPTQEEELWRVFSEFNFDAQGLILNFAPYAVAAYAFGKQEVQIPWYAVSDFLAPRFKTGPLGKIVSAQTRPRPAELPTENERK
jgi:hypothetical protein